MGEQDGGGDERGTDRDRRPGKDAVTGGSAAARPAKPAPKLVFGDPLDRQSSDDTDRGWGERPGEGGASRGLDWYLSQRPPHHGE
ncbi:hypothetical protein [Kitasatospora sp. NPDC051914]|uniref:hypothetical protein n=1 Tax=Kitasatospora sp. NPDC051914 TaxID=3154945 RepID=UPI003430C234